MRVLVLVLVSLAAVASCGGATAEKGVVSYGTTVQPVSKEQALADFEVVRSVLQHPRCQNCHPAGDAPLQGDESVVHTQNIQRGPEGKGMAGAECTTCHGPANPPDSYGIHVPPGVSKGWHMPGPDHRLVFVGVAPGALCEQVRDPVKNGGMRTEALVKHIDDPLVTWGWAPGRGRAPIPVARETFKKKWNEWLASGAPCPADPPLAKTAQQ